MLVPENGCVQPKSCNTGKGVGAVTKNLVARTHVKFNANSKWHAVIESPKQASVRLQY